MKLNKDDIVEVFDKTKNENILCGQIVSVKNESHVWFRYQKTDSMFYKDIKFIKIDNLWICEFNSNWQLTITVGVD